MRGWTDQAPVKTRRRLTASASRPARPHLNEARTRLQRRGRSQRHLVGAGMNDAPCWWERRPPMRKLALGPPVALLSLTLACGSAAANGGQPDPGFGSGGEVAPAVSPAAISRAADGTLL